MSAQKRTIVVIGATGAQGGGLVRAILDDPEARFAVRAVTRKPDSEPARRLAELGAEVVAADLDDQRSLKKAFAGAWGAFCVTNFWEHFSPEKELAQAAHLAEAAWHADIDHVIWSTLEDTRIRVPLADDRMPTLMGRYKVPHFDAKGEANAEFRDRQLPTTFLLTSFYWENFISFGLEPKRAEDGVLELAMPMADQALPGIGVEDIGKCAFGIFAAGSRYVGETVGVAGEHLTGKEMARALGNALGETVRYNAIEPDVFRSLGFPGAEDLGNMYQYKAEFNAHFRRARNVEQARKLNPELKSFRSWLDENAERIPVDRAAA